MSNTQEPPSIGIGVAIIKNSRILLTKRRDFPVWCIPGGHLLPGESVFEAAIREVKEETGLVVKLVGLIGVYSMPYKWENGSCEIIIRGHQIGGKLLTLTNETIDAGYFSKTELPSDLIGWQYHQIVDALGNMEGVVSVLNARLSLSQFRTAEKQLEEGDISSKEDMLSRLCELPDRVDLHNGDL